MTHDEAVTLTEGLRARFNTTFSPFDKRTIEALYAAVLGKTFRVTSCQRCYHDAVIEIALHLRKYTTMAKEKKYAMRAGFIIACPTFHNGEIYTNDNLTDEIAAEYLAMFPKQIAMFSRVPEKAVLTTAGGTKTAKVGNVPPSARKPRKTQKTKK